MKLPLKNLELNKRLLILLDLLLPLRPPRMLRMKLLKMLKPLKKLKLMRLPPMNKPEHKRKLLMPSPTKLHPNRLL